ncbi:MAG: hypothetical protein OEY49_00460 [Candidatus Heimdallarchaeota archaeon]|nr:hypothetical protein [Candidatus Heimdallarchaeota archaeon]
MDNKTTVLISICIFLFLPVSNTAISTNSDFQYRFQQFKIEPSKMDNLKITPNSSHGDSINTAISIELNQTVNDVLPGPSDDGSRYYNLTLNQTSTIYLFTLHYNTNSDFDMVIYNSNQEEIGYAYAEIEFEYYILDNLTDFVYIKIIPWIIDDPNYELLVISAPPGSDFSTAIDIQLNQTVNEELTRIKYPKFFQINLTEFDNYQVTIMTNETLDFDFNIYNEERELIAESYYTEREMDWIRLYNVSGFYYIEVYSYLHYGIFNITVSAFILDIPSETPITPQQTSNTTTTSSNVGFEFSAISTIIPLALLIINQLKYKKLKRMKKYN